MFSFVYLVYECVPFALFVLAGHCLNTRSVVFLG